MAALALSTGAASAATPEFYGVSPQEELSKDDFTHLAEGRVATIRLPFNWGTFQEVKGRCQAKEQAGVCTWHYMDDLMGRLALAGVRVIPVLIGSPRFVYGRHPDRPPVKKGLSGWRAFLEAAAKRYGHGGIYWRSYSGAYATKPQPVTEWQVWNEQNAEQFWHPKPNARVYGKLLKASAAALDEGDPQAKVVIGGMFIDAKVSIGAYMRKLYAVKGIRGSFDELGVHPYARTIKQLERQLGSARKALRRGDDRATGMRVTEIGWSSAEGDHRLMVGRERQATLLDRSFALIESKREEWNVTGLNWFALRDTQNKQVCSFCTESGLFGVGGAPKPAWQAFTKFSRP